MKRCFKGILAVMLALPLGACSAPSAPSVSSPTSRSDVSALSGSTAATAANPTPSNQTAGSITAAPTAGHPSSATAATAPVPTATPAVAPKTPCIVTPRFAAEDIIVADVFVSPATFDVDPTGKADSTNGIQQALDKCSILGGTVWLPAGRYRLTESLNIPDFVTLRGDWQDPDKGNEYGTILLADIPSSDVDGGIGLLMLGGSSGVMGLTVYYPNQHIDNVKPYPYTFYVSHAMLQSIVNCTVINGYRGIGACVLTSEGHEMMTIDNVKGTFLYRGARAFNQSDVGTWKNLTLSNRYWANANTSLGMTRPSRASLDAYTRASGVGLELGDLEWTQFANVTVENYQTGIQIVSGHRIQFAGSLYDVTVKNCDYALKVDNLDARWGMVVAKSQLSGSRYAVCNRSGGTVKLAGVSLSGAVEGDVRQESASLDAYTVSYTRTAPKPRAALYTVDADRFLGEDCSTALQTALNKAGAAGGGVVYLSGGGQYVLKKPVSVPAGVELRGCSPVAQREQSGSSKGTIIFVQTGADSFSPDTATAAITLAGKNAGVRGIRFFYPDNPYTDLHPYPYTIRGRAAGVYAIHVAIAAGYNGVDFLGCDNHLVKKLVGCCYNNMLTVGGKSGMIEGCLQNGTTIVRQGLGLTSWPGEDTLFTHLFTPITRVQTEYIRIVNADGQTVINTFAYGIKTLVVTTNSTNVKLINLGADNIGSGSPLLNLTGGSVTGINIMRYNGISYQNQHSALKLYNRLTILDKSEPTVME